MSPIKITVAILIMILPGAIEVAEAADPAATAAASTGIVESLLLVIVGGILVSLAALGRRTLRKSPNRVHHVPAFPQQRN